MISNLSPSCPCNEQKKCLSFSLTFRLLQDRIQSVADIDGHGAFSQHGAFLGFLPLLHLLPPFVGCPVHVDELLVALVCDDGVLYLFSPPCQNFLLNLFGALFISNSSVQLGVPDLFLVVWEPSPDEYQQWERHHYGGNDGEDQSDTENEAEYDVE